MRLLLVEKQVSMSTFKVSNDRCVVERADSVDDAVSVLRHEIYDLVVVSISSLLQDGFDLIRRMRVAKNMSPILALTGGNAADRIRALNLGADDAVAEPVDNAELGARIASIIRRSTGFSQSKLHVGDLTLCPASQEVTFIGLPARMTDKEFLILELLVLRRGSVVTKEAILNHLYGEVDEPSSKIIDVFVCKIRKKLEQVGACELIGTVWGRGYTIREQDAHRRSDGLVVQPHARQLAH
jgi:two-component system cell cycle response regulator CtrA